MICLELWQTEARATVAELLKTSEVIDRLAQISVKRYDNAKDAESAQPWLLVLTAGALNFWHGVLNMPRRGEDFHDFHDDFSELAGEHPIKRGQLLARIKLVKRFSYTWDYGLVDCTDI